MQLQSFGNNGEQQSVNHYRAPRMDQWTFMELCMLLQIACTVQTLPHVI